MPRPSSTMKLIQRAREYSKTMTPRTPIAEEQEREEEPQHKDEDASKKPLKKVFTQTDAEVKKESARIEKAIEQLMMHINKLGRNEKFR